MVGVVASMCCLMWLLWACFCVAVGVRVCRGLGGCALGLLAAELQLDFVAVEGCSGKCVYIAYNVAPVFVYYCVVQLH